jgi:phage-related protein
MGTTTFTYAPDYQAQESHTPNVRVAKFGDGYEQRIRFGINTDKPTWNLRFDSRDNTEGTAIKTFLAARGAWDSFNWTPPSYASAIKVVCRTWNAAPVRGTGLAGDGSLQSIWSINATFEQVMEP